MAELLARARASGAIARALGERWFVSSGERSLIRVTCALEGDGLAITNEWRSVEWPGASETRSVLDARGRLLAFSVAVEQHGHPRVELECEVVDREPRLVRARVGDDDLQLPLADVPTGRSAPPDAVPFDLLWFVLPTLHDQGLPERWRLRAVRPALFGLSTAESTKGKYPGLWKMRLEWINTADERGRLILLEEGDPMPTTRVVLSPAGELQSVTLMKGMVMRATSAEHGRELYARALQAR